MPMAKRIEMVRENPAMPVAWGRNQPGMVADEVLSDNDANECHSVWLEAAQAACDYATYLCNKKLHKQLVNRVLEPYSWHTSVVSSTDWTNMFRQRIHHDAQPEFKALAEKMKEALESSSPEMLTPNEWHLPYIGENERALPVEVKRKISVARIARTSYLNQGQIDVDKDLSLYDRLISADPPHL
jgi:thymidylate synthase ThyX